jgi:alpha-D-ribose 1-methylphosphonate 5-triphosphate diphosphatase PhnM
MASGNPARVGRIAGRRRGLNPGERADLVRFRYNSVSKEVRVLETYLNGVRVFTG